MLENLTGHSPGIVAAFLVTIFFAGMVRGYTGFGTSALVVSAMSLAVPVASIVPVVVVLEIAASMQMVPRVIHKVDRSILGLLMLGSLVSIPVGHQLLIYMDPAHSRLAVNCMVLAVVGFMISGRSLENWRNRKFYVATGVASGLANGMVAMGGLVTSVLLLAAGLRIEVMRATLVAILFISCIYATISGLLNGLVTMTTFSLSLLMLPPLVLGIRIGHKRFDPARTTLYRRATLGLLTFLAVSGIAYTLRG
jgi:uncharacterized protein